MWPFDAHIADVRDRVRAYLTKALREAKVHTSWLSPDEEYESAAAGFVDAILDEPAVESVHADVPAVPGARRRARHLQQPGAAPDQDHRARGARFLPGHGALGSQPGRSRQPSPRRLRHAAVACSPACRSASPKDSDIAGLLAHRADGRIKMFTTARALRQRAEMRDVFDHGEYVPLVVRRGRAATACSRLRAPRRRSRRDHLRAETRRVARAGRRRARRLGAAVWGDTRIELLPAQAATDFRNALVGTTVRAADGALLAADVFQQLPIALLAS